MSTIQEHTKMILSLNCARGESSTYAVLSFVSSNPKYQILLLQEPWLNSNKEPPPLNGFELFTPAPINPKCATYIRKDAQLQPSLALSESDSFLGIRLRLHSNTTTFSKRPPMQTTIYNFYSPARQRAICHFFQGFRPDTNANICGDFNSHHQMWYGHRSAQHARHLFNDASLANQLVDKLVDLAFDLQNVPGLYTHFPRNNSSPSVIDLTFTWGQAS